MAHLMVLVMFYLMEYGITHCIITDVGSMLAIETVLSFGTNGTYKSSKPAF